MSIPAEEESTAGADSVVKLVEGEDAIDDINLFDLSSVRGPRSPKGLEGLTAQELYWLQVEEGPGAWEREMELVDEMAQGKWAAPGAYERGGGGNFSVDEEEYEDEDETDGDGPGAYALGPAAPWTGRKRSVDELDGDAADAHGSGGGTPPKRARTGERASSPRLAKRRSDSAELDDRDAETASTGSAPKRARVDQADSPPDSSTPGTEDSASASAYDSDIRTTPRNAVLSSK
jgi:hypothetical protein